MFIIIKNSSFTPKYFVIEETQTSTMYRYSENISEATEFSSEQLATSALKRSGFYAHVGLNIVTKD